MAGKKAMQRRQTARASGTLDASRRANPAEIRRFLKKLDEASEIVRGWPDWKPRVLGGNTIETSDAEVVETIVAPATGTLSEAAIEK